MITNLTDSTFNEDLPDGVSLVDFWAAWCGPCRMLNPILKDLSEDQDIDANIIKVDVDSNQQTAMQFGIRSIPTMIIFKDKEPVKTLVGMQSKEQILDAIKEI